MNKDWIEVELGEICDFKGGGTPSKSNPDYWNGNIPWASIKDIKGDLLTKTQDFISEDGLNNSSANIAEPDEIIIGTRINPGRPIITKIRTAVNQDLKIIKPKINVSTNFLFYSFKNLENAILKVSSGTTVLGINLTNLRQINFPLAPLPEQRAIVAKIEQLFSELDNGIQNLETAQRKLTLYRQAVLKKAFEGGFTEQWRKEKEKLPTAGELLAEIEEERESYHLHQVEKWKQGIKRWEENGKVEKKPSKPSKLTIPTKPSNEHLDRTWEIPKNWVWTQLGNFCFVTKLAGFEYTEYIDYNDLGDLPVIKAENAGINGFKKTDYSKVESVSVKSLTRSELFGGELLVVFVGAGTGNVAVVPNDKKYFLGPNIAMAKPYLKVNTKYVEYFLRSSFGKNLILAAVKAVAQPSLSMETIRQVPIAFTSLTEQHQIVQEIESRLSVCDKVQETITQNLQKAEALRQSILKKAFAGNLLTEKELTACRNEPDYAPASELLKEIVN
jgi:type I restriction enzyme S subunit